MFLFLKVVGVIVVLMGNSLWKFVLEWLKDVIFVVCFDSFLCFNLLFVGNDNVQSVLVIVQYFCCFGELLVFLDVLYLVENINECIESYFVIMVWEGYLLLVIVCDVLLLWEFEWFGYEQMNYLLVKGGLLGKILFCVNDCFVFGVMVVVFVVGFKIGRVDGCDICIVGYDDYLFSCYVCLLLMIMV